MGIRNLGTLLIIFLILMMVFGTHRLRDIGNDLAAAIRNFRKGLQEDDEREQDQDQDKDKNKDKDAYRARAKETLVEHDQQETAEKNP